MTYSLAKINNFYTLTVEQETNIKLYYISYGIKELIEEKTVTATYEIITKKDGDYVLELSAGEEIEEENLYIYNYLRDSIVNNILDYKGCDDNVSCSTLYKKSETLSSDKNILNKILVYQNKYISKINSTEYSKFYNFINSAVESNNCNVQKSINNIVNKENLNIVDNQDKTLFESFLFLYWIGFYFVDKSILTEVEDIEELKTIFKYEDILDKYCNICFDIEDLETLFI